MAKSKYKIGTLVKFVQNGTATYEEITGILTTKEGNRYVVGGEPNDSIEENSVLQAYTPRREPKARTKTKSVRRTKSVQAASEEQAA